MGVPKAAVDYYNRVDKLGARANKTAREAWKQVDSKNVRESWQEIAGMLAVSVAAGRFGLLMRVRRMVRTRWLRRAYMSLLLGGFNRRRLAGIPRMVRRLI